MTFIAWTTATMLIGAPTNQVPPITLATQTVPSVPDGAPSVPDNATAPVSGPAQGMQAAPSATMVMTASETLPALAEPATPVPQEQQGEHDIVIIARDPAAKPDPFHAINLQAFQATQAVDRNLIGPVSLAYKHTIPRPIRSGIHNFLYNLREPVVFVNFFLQHKIGKAAETVGRFAINSTIGIAGVLDVAKNRPFKLPRRGNSFDDTLGFYGVPSGPFMFLPIVGPTTVRDLFGGFIDRLILPAIVGRKIITNPAYSVPAAVLGVLDHRAEFDATLHTLHDNAPDPYENTREFYLRRRQAEIDQLRGHGSGNSSPMSEAPTDPLRLKHHLRPIEPSAPKPPKHPISKVPPAN